MKKIFLLFLLLSTLLDAEEAVPIEGDVDWDSILDELSFVQNNGADGITLSEHAKCLNSFLALRRDELELIWWRSENRQVRFFSLSLMALMTPTDSFESRLSKFVANSRRFAEKEKNERIVEILRIRHTYKSFAKELLRCSQLNRQQGLKEIVSYYQEKHVFSAEAFKKYSEFPKSETSP